MLSHRNIEWYLLHDDVLTRLCEMLRKPEARDDLLAAKGQALEASVAAGGPRDDLKRIAGNVFNAAKRIFDDKKLGSDHRAFMKGHCAPVIRDLPDLYNELRADIFG